MNEFDLAASEWDAKPVRADRANQVAVKIRAQAPLHPGMAALEYGCGTGLLSFALQPYLGQITLADSSDGMLQVLAGKIATAGVSNMHPMRLDLTCDPPPAERFDLVYTLMVLHHIRDTQGVLNKLGEMLKPGGWLCIADLDQEDGSFHGPDQDVHLGFAREALQGQLEAAGFEAVGFITAYEMSRETAQGLRIFPMFLATAQKKTTPPAATPQNP